MGAPLHATASSRLACEHSRGKTCLQLDAAGHRSLTQVSHSLPSLMKSPWQQALQAVQPPVPPCPWVAVALHSKSKRVGHCASWFTAWLPQFTCTHSVADAREWRVGEARSTSVEAVRVSPPAPYQAVVLPLRRLDAAGLVARAPHARGAGGTVRAGQADLAGAAVAGGEDGAGLVVLVVS